MAKLMQTGSIIPVDEKENIHLNRMYIKYVQAYKKYEHIVMDENSKVLSFEIFAIGWIIGKADGVQSMAGKVVK